jgi:hypothetical protein
VIGEEWPNLGFEELRPVIRSGGIDKQERRGGKGHYPAIHERFLGFGWGGSPDDNSPIG